MNRRHSHVKGFSIDNLVVLTQMACVIVVMAQVVTASPFLKQSLSGKRNWKQTFIIILLFGLLSIYGTYSGLEIPGARINIRDLKPMMAGLIAGPYAGIGAGMIGGGDRYLMGGITVVPCSLATVLAGLIGGFIHLKYLKRFCRIEIAVAFAILMECLHMILQLTMVQPFPVAVEIVSTSAIPMIAANAVGMAAFAIIITVRIRKEQGE